MTKYSLVSNDEHQNITVLIDGELYTATDTHANWESIVAKTLDGTVTVEDFDTAKKVADKFAALSERVSVAGGHVFFDGDEVNSVLTDHILRAYEEGADFLPLVRFYENLAQNPSEDSRQQLYGFLKAEDFTITDDGMILAYKGVASTGDPDVFQSISSGTAQVNGVTQTGHIQQKIGDVVTMPRSSVTFDPNVACSVGLHVGTWNYASTFAPFTLQVKVNPRDVVSVPTDHNNQKMRVCRYESVSVVDNKWDSAVVSFDEDLDWEDEEEWDDEEESAATEVHYTDHFVPQSTLAADLFYDRDTKRLWIAFTNSEEHYYCYEVENGVWDYLATLGNSVGYWYNTYVKGSKRLSEQDVWADDETYFTKRAVSTV